VRTFVLGLGLVLLTVPAFASDSLPWKGRIVFDARVRVDDAAGPANHPATHPQTIMDDDWNMYTVWADDRDNNGEFEVFFALSRDTGRTWSAPNVNLSQSPSQYYLFPWLAADRTGLYVVWQSWNGTDWKLFFTRSTDQGITWNAAAEVPGITVVNNLHSGINFGPQPKLAVDSRSNPDTTFLYLLWADNAAGSIQIKLARSTDLGVSFTDMGIVDKNPGNVNRHPYLAVDDSGWVHCAFARGTSGSNQDPHCWIGYNRSSDRGTTFLESDIVVNDDVTGVYRGNPSLTYDPLHGDVLISWEDSRRSGGNANPDVWFSRIHRDSFTPAPNQRVNWPQPDTSVHCDNYKPAIRMDPRAVMVAAWHDDPGLSGSFGIHLAAYTDSLGRFSNSRSLVQTFTGTGSGSFGNDFYPPSLFVRFLVGLGGADTVTHFFVVWQDFSEDSLGGNIYSVHGRVVTRPPWPYGWREVRPPVPVGATVKGLKDGAWLAMNENSGLVCVAKGTKCAEFYCYDPMDTTVGAWVALSPWPLGTENKLPTKGSCGISDNAGHIYATKGSNSSGFWRYSFAGNYWTQLADVPLVPSNKKVKGGSDMVYVVENDTGYVYLLKGYQNDFLRYNILSDRWEVMPLAPIGAKPKWDKGSWLAFTGGPTIYAHKSKFNELWPFDLVTHSWGAQLTGMPVLSPLTAKNKKAKDGSSAAPYGSYIYALKGGGTCELWRYHTTTDVWNEEDTMPSIGSTLKRKPVKSGGDIVSYGDWWAFFALKGNKTFELWRFVDSMPLAPGMRLGGGPMARRLDAHGQSLSVVPSVAMGGVITVSLGAAAGWSPEVSALTISDISGRKVMNLVPGKNDVSALAPGIYFVKLEAQTRTQAVRKVVIAK